MDRLANVERMKKLAEEWKNKPKAEVVPAPEPEKVEEEPAKKRKKDEVVEDEK